MILITAHASLSLPLPKTNDPIDRLISKSGLTWRPTPPTQDQSFAAMRTALSLGANNWNGGELYGPPERNSLHLLNEYFTQYPEDAEKVVLSIKGGLVPGQMKPDGSEKGVQRSIDECLKVLDGKKFLDLFECGELCYRSGLTCGTDSPT